jgi:hypothetical protein
MFTDFSEERGVSLFMVTIIYPEDEGTILFRIVDTYIPDCAVFYPGRQQHGICSDATAHLLYCQKYISKNAVF